jgi:hypothetical protein
MFWEVDSKTIGIERKWLFYAKGGDYRRWYGNIYYVIDWSKEAREFYHKNKIARIISDDLWYKKGISWNFFTASKPSFRILPCDATFDVIGSSILTDLQSKCNST